MEEYSAPSCFKCKIFNISQERSEVTRLGNFLSHPANFRNYRRTLHIGSTCIRDYSYGSTKGRTEFKGSFDSKRSLVSNSRDFSAWNLGNLKSGGGKNSLKFLLRLQFLQLFILFIGTKHMKFWTFSRISCLNNSQLTLCIPNIFSSGEATTLDD